MLGWLLAIPLTALGGDWRIGERFRNAGFFLVPSEVSPLHEVRALRRSAGLNRFRAADPAVAAAIDPVIHRLLTGLVPNDRANLHHEIWATPAAELDPVWQRELARLDMRTR